MRISVVILTCNDRARTLRCLESLDVSRLSREDAEVILVDNGSADGTAEAVSDRFPGVRLLLLPENIGVAPGRNAGVAEARGRLIMFLDNDTVASPEAVLALADYLDANPAVGLVAPRLTDAHGRTQSSFKPYPGLRSKLRNVLTPKDRSSYAAVVPEGPAEPFYVIGAAQMFTREVWTSAGGLDPAIFFGPEDADFCMAVRKAGKKVVYLPQISIVHLWQRSTSGRFTPAARRHMAALIHFWKKHRRFW